MVDMWYSVVHRQNVYLGSSHVKLIATILVKHCLIVRCVIGTRQVSQHVIQYRKQLIGKMCFWVPPRSCSFGQNLVAIRNNFSKAVILHR